MGTITNDNVPRAKGVLRPKLLRMLILTTTLLIVRGALADMASPFEVRNKVGDVPEGVAYVVALDHKVEDCKFYFVIITSIDWFEHVVFKDTANKDVVEGIFPGGPVIIRATADKGVVKESLLGRPAVIKAKVTDRKEDPKTKDVVVQLKILSMWSREVELYEDLRGNRLEGRNKDLTRLDLRNCDLTRTTFDSLTQWPAPERMPEGFKPEELMEWGKYPGLGIRQLHSQGITGRGVHVAIIDQPLLENHIEYRDQLTSYTEIQTDNAGPQRHGSAVASILVGRTCGVAPEANLHYWAQPSWKGDYQYRCKALEQIIEYNKGKPLSLQIRIVSVSKGFSFDWPNFEKWKALLDEAKRNGIYVIHCSRNMFGVGCPAYQDSDEPGNYQLCAFYPRPVYHEPGALFAPVDNRTMASPEAEEAYMFYSKGGLSWGAPYIAGVAALGVQVKPDLTESDIERLLYESGWDFQKGKLINPVGFIEAVKKLKANR